MDVYVGKADKTYYGRPSIKAFGFPKRINVTKTTTCHDAYEMAWQIVRR